MDQFKKLTAHPQVQQVLQSPLAQNSLAAILALGFLRYTNRTLSRWSLNNWNSDSWQGEKELVLLTGGTGGIGRQIMEDLSQAGARVVIVDVKEPEFKLPKNVSFYICDITNSASLKTVGDKIRQAHGEPTVLINNAGVGHDGTILEEPEDKIRQTFEVNTVSHFMTVREFLPDMIKKNHGHVITIASMASFMALGEMVDYCCTKSSALAFHEGLRQELKFWYHAPKVRTSVIHPLWVRTAMIKQLTDAGDQFNQPVLTPQTVSAAVVKQILTQSSGQVILPSRLTHYSLVRAFPSWMQETARGIGSGILRKLRDRKSVV